MVNVGILGSQDVGKTSTFLLFMKKVEESGDRILHGVPGGQERDKTLTVDFIRFTWKGFVHVLYGTGGHRLPSVDYYRLWVIRNADRFLCMADLAAPLEPQLEFYRSFEIPARNVVLSLNKYDTGKENLGKKPSKASS
jgi:signal recognition particle receptor subunit beta